MKMQYAIAYVSHVTSDVSDDEVRTLMEASKLKNNGNDLSGVLLYSEGNFFQVVEGEKDTVLKLFEKIKTDTRHKAIITILESSIIKRTSNCYEAEFISQDKITYGYIASEYFHCIQSLDLKSQSIVKAIFNTFIK